MPLSVPVFTRITGSIYSCLVKGSFKSQIYLFIENTIKKTKASENSVSLHICMSRRCVSMCVVVNCFSVNYSALNILVKSLEYCQEFII